MRQYGLETYCHKGTASGGTIQYLRENGNVGAAGVWDGTGAIAELDPKPGYCPSFI